MKTGPLLALIMVFVVLYAANIALGNYATVAFMTLCLLPVGFPWRADHRSNR